MANVVDRVEDGRPRSLGRDSAIFLISHRRGYMNFGCLPPAYFGYNESKRSSLKLWNTSRTGSSDVNADPAISRPFIC